MHRNLPAVRWVGGVELELIAIATGKHTPISHCLFLLLVSREGSTPVPNITDCRRTDCSEIPRVESGKAWKGIALMYYIVYFQPYGICMVTLVSFFGCSVCLSSYMNFEISALLSLTV